MIDSNTLGAINEMKAGIWLMEQGFQVFFNVKGVGPADIIAWNPETDETLKIDVKTAHVYIKADGSKTYNSSLGSVKNKKKFITYLGYCPEEDSFMWL